MIRVDLGAEVSPGVFEFSIPSLRLCGKSRQPLLDACREIKRMGGDTRQRAGLFREGRDAPDLFCEIGYGANRTSSEGQRHGPVLRKYQPFDVVLREAAE